MRSIFYMVIENNAVVTLLILFPHSITLSHSTTFSGYTQNPSLFPALA